MAPQIFQTEGPIIDPDSPVYIERPEDSRILELIRQRRYVTLLGAWQTGKTSLLYGLRKRLEKDPYVPVLINLSVSAGMAEREWYQRLCREILSQLGSTISLNESEKEGLERTSSHGEFDSFLLEIASKAESLTRIVVMLDEVGTVPKDFSDGFFGVVRAVFDERGVKEAFGKYVFIFAGAISPGRLISSDSPNSPFNVSQEVYTSDFERSNIGKLVEHLGERDVKVREEIIDCIYGWTRGYPNLTQKICAALADRGDKALSPELVEQAAERLVTTSDKNIWRLRDRLDSSDQAREWVRDILTGAMAHKLDRNEETVADLELIGIIREEKGECVIRNKIYKKALKNYLDHVPAAPQAAEPDKQAKDTRVDLVLDSITFAGLLALVPILLTGKVFLSIMGAIVVLLTIFLIVPLLKRT